MTSSILVLDEPLCGLFTVPFILPTQSVKGRLGIKPQHLPFFLYAEREGRNVGPDENPEEEVLGITILSNTVGVEVGSCAHITLAPHQWGAAKISKEKIVHVCTDKIYLIAQDDSTNYHFDCFYP